ncbi:hypothetical protein [Marinomonas sp. FW-1]|uniref:hypothetical protein n=1 Tax=Marinomonas sp. FW-1 TaxID=2071621 RepID=UPI0010C1370B|nr:hypothetical protein [Marinomonas sp. FW-1]
MAYPLVLSLCLFHTPTRLRGSSKENALNRLSELMPRSNGLPSVSSLRLSYPSVRQCGILKERALCRYFVYLSASSKEVMSRSNGLPSVSSLRLSYPSVRQCGILKERALCHLSE